MSDAHNTHAWKQLRRRRLIQAAANNEPCGLCGRPIPYGIPYKTRGKISSWYPTIDHTHTLAQGGDPTPTPDMLQPAHHYCQSQQGQWLRNVTRAQRIGATPPPQPRFTGPKGRPPTPTQRTNENGRVSSRTDGAPPRRVFLRTPPGFGQDSTDYSSRDVWNVPWLRDVFAEIPETAQLPRLMTVPHPLAVGSYGAEAEALVRHDFKTELRWWQRLALLRELEHDADGRLVWEEVVSSTARRSGKSTKLRTKSWWRMRQSERFREPQLVMFTGKDLPICKEIHRRAWPWALAHSDEGVVLRRTNGQEEIELPDGGRWAVRGQDSVYGYDVCQGDIDEAWAVPVSVVDDGLEPSLLDRASPQLGLTSTAHRRAKSLMLGRIAQARQELTEPDAVLLLLWGAPADAVLDDRQVWRSSQPHWTPTRERLMERKWRKATLGEREAEDRDPDEPDPVEAFKAQYLNIWPSRASARVVGVIGVEQWEGLGVPGWPGGDTSIAVESALNAASFAVARAARRDDGGVTVDAVEVSTLGEVRAVVDRWRDGRHPVWVGKSIIGLADPRWGARALTQDKFAEASASFLEAWRVGGLAHLTGGDDGSLSGQVPLLQAKGVGNGAVLTSKENPVHVARSAVWAVWAALSRKPEAFVL